MRETEGERKRDHHEPLSCAQHDGLLLAECWCESHREPGISKLPQACPFKETCASYVRSLCTIHVFMHTHASSKMKVVRHGATLASVLSICQTYELA